MSKLVFFSAATYFFSMFVWLLFSLVVIAVIGIPVDTDIECHIDNDLLYASYTEAFGFLVTLIATMVICFRYFFLPTTVIGRVQFGALIYAMHFMIFGWLLSDCQIEFLDEVLNLLTLIFPPVIVGKYFDKYMGAVKNRDTRDNTLAEEEKAIAETRRVAWRAFFAKKKTTVILCFLITCVGLPFILWDDGLDRHFRSGDFSLSAAIIVEFIMTIAVSWFGLLITVIDAFAVFHGFKGFIPLTRVHNCIRSPFISRGWRWVCLVTTVLVFLGVLYSVNLLMTLF